MNNKAPSLFVLLTPPRSPALMIMPLSSVLKVLKETFHYCWAAEQKAGFSCHISSWLFIRVSFFCRRKRTLISYVYSYTNLFKYFQELSINALPGIPNPSSLFHYSVVLHRLLTWDAVRERPHRASLALFSIPLCLGKLSLRCRRFHLRPLSAACKMNPSKYYLFPPCVFSPSTSSHWLALVHMTPLRWACWLVRPLFTIIPIGPAAPHMMSKWQRQ